MSADIVVSNAVLIPMTEKGLMLQPGYVAVKDGVITGVGKDSPPQLENARSIDAGGRVLMHGLVNAHTHLYQVLLRAVWEDLPLFPWLDTIGKATTTGVRREARGGKTRMKESRHIVDPHHRLTGQISP